MDPSQINWLAVAAAALSTFVVGGLWYSPALFARPWMRANGLSEERLRQGGVGKVFGGAAVLALVMAVNLAFFLGKDAGAAWGAGAGALAGVGWVGAGLGTLYLFERRPLALFLINGGYMAVAFTLMGTIIGAWS
jgi:hypothetical protein